MIHREIEIWDKNEYNGADKEFAPRLATYILKAGDKEADAAQGGNRTKKGAVLILPGGGYGGTSWREAEPIAMWANAAGYNAFVLYYSVAPNRHPQPLLDVTRAMCIIRDNAECWNTDPAKIAVCGFSAGGHLAASLGVHYNAPYLQGIKGMEEGKNRPNAMILCYPVISAFNKPNTGSFENLLGKNAPESLLKEMSLELHVSQSTPPAFIWTTFNDEAVPVENSLAFAGAMRDNNVPFELHIFPDGVHGLSLCNEQTWHRNPSFINPHAAVWTSLCGKWLAQVL